jgi:hypothetical protein
MAVINLRQDKERPLTIEEVDSNFDELNKELATKLDANSLTADNLLQILNGEAGAGSTLDADKIHGYYPSKTSQPNTVAIRDALSNLYANQFHGVHIGAVLGNVTGNLTGTVTGNASNVDGVVQVEHGGTGATTAQNARFNLGLGSMATQNKNAVDITGGAIVGITDLSVADGGTGASTASGARSNLGLVIGADIQAYDAILSGVSTTTGDGFLVRSSTDAAYTRKFVAGNSIEITNPTGVAGDITFAVSLIPSFSAITKVGDNGVGNIGQTDNRYNVIYGRSTSATYADLAEKYTTDKEYAPGTVMVVAMAGEAEATACFQTGQRVMGVISTNPAFVMNDEIDGQAIGLTGRVPVLVVGPIRKGQTIISNQDGKAIAGDGPNVFGQALETNLDAGVKLVECFIK